MARLEGIPLSLSEFLRSPSYATRVPHWVRLVHSHGHIRLTSARPESLILLYSSYEPRLYREVETRAR